MDVVLEALLFASPEPLTVSALARGLKVFYTRVEVEAGLRRLAARYERAHSGVQLVRIAGGWRLVTRPEYYEQVASVLGHTRTVSLTPAGLETLSLIAYKQPISKAQVEAIPGVQSDGVLKSLIDLDLVRVVGRDESLGRAFLYGTTRKFLEHFGLNGIRDLPRPEA